MMNAKEAKNLRVFGYGLAIIISFFAIRLGVKHNFTQGNYIALTIAAVLALTTAAHLPAVKPVYRIWMKGARFIGEIVNFVILSFIFYTFFAVVGLVLRLIRKDLLEERIDKKAQTYWKPSRCGVFDREHYTKQY